MTRIEFVTQKPPTSPTRFAVVSYTDAQGREHVRTGYGNDDLQRIADALARLCLATPRVRREWHRAFTTTDQKLRKAIHRERVAANVATMRKAAAGAWRAAA